MTNFDFTGLDVLWDIIDEMEKGDEPDEKLWVKLFNTPGYAVLTFSEFTREFFKKRFRQAFKPAQRMETREPDRFVKHYRRVVDQKDTLIEKAKAIKNQCPVLVGTAYTLCKEMLPVQPDSPPPLVSFLVFDNDARGYKPIVVDILYAQNIGENLAGLLAHEFFHYFADKLLVYNPQKVAPEDEDILWVLKQIQEEGIADHIWALVNSEYLRLVEESPCIIAEMDRLIKEMACVARRQKELGRELRRILPWAGHPTGNYMAARILEEEGRDMLIATIGNPFSFFALYNRCAVAKGERAFSKQTLSFLEKLRKRYHKK